MPTTRRQFLRNTVCAAVGSTSIVRTLFDLGNINAAAATRSPAPSAACLPPRRGTSSSTRPAT